MRAEKGDGEGAGERVTKYSKSQRINKVFEIIFMSIGSSCLTFAYKKSTKRKRVFLLFTWKNRFCKYLWKKRKRWRLQHVRSMLMLFKNSCVRNNPRVWLIEIEGDGNENENIELFFPSRKLFTETLSLLYTIHISMLYFQLFEHRTTCVLNCLLMAWHIIRFGISHFQLISKHNAMKNIVLL